MEDKDPVKAFVYEVNVTIKMDIGAEDDDIAMDLALLEMEEIKNYLAKKSHGWEINDDELYEIL